MLRFKALVAAVAATVGFAGAAPAATYQDAYNAQQAAYSARALASQSETNNARYLTDTWERHDYHVAWYTKNKGDMTPAQQAEVEGYLNESYGYLTGDAATYRLAGVDQVTEGDWDLEDGDWYYSFYQWNFAVESYYAAVDHYQSAYTAFGVSTFNIGHANTALDNSEGVLGGFPVPPS